MSDADWNAVLSGTDIDYILAVAVRHEIQSLEDIDDELPPVTKFAVAGCIIHHYRDFCGGVMVESGYVDTNMGPTWQYRYRQILAEDVTGQGWVQKLPHINDLGLEHVPTTQGELRTLLEKSLAGAVVTQALNIRKSLIHYMDKVGGRLSQIMSHVEDSTLYNVPCSNVTVNNHRPSPWAMPDSANVANLTASTMEYPEVTITCDKTEPTLNTNSGNDVQSTTLHVSPGDDDPAPEFAYCDACGEEFEYDGDRECPGCGDVLFSAEVSYSFYGRPVEMMLALKEAFRHADAWRFMPHSVWRNG
jgi:hypothetical protein